MAYGRKKQAPKDGHVRDSPFSQLIEQDECVAELRREYAVRGRPSSLLAGAGTNRTEALGAINADRKDLKEQLRTLLGDSRYSQYTDYQQTAAERTQLNAYKQLSACDANLTDDQTEQLLAVN